MLEKLLLPEIEEYSEEYDTVAIWFQQDRVTAYTARLSRQILQKLFPARLISLRGLIRDPLALRV